jgi:xylan 1,4-beta-xylosidase
MDLGPISPYVYGSNYSMYGAVPAGMMDYALNSHITVFRFPGGSWGDQNDLMDYQIDMFMNFCKQLGTMPTISVRLLNGTPEAAAKLVRYINIEQKYGVVYWSIGNEPDLYTGLPGVDYDVARFNREWRAIALAMKAVDPSIKLLGPELSQWGTELAKTPKYPPTRTPTGQERQDWMTEFLKANSDLVDIVTVHRYPLYHADGRPSTIDELRQNTLEWGDMVVYLRNLIHETIGRDIPIAFTEVNSDPSNVVGGVASPDSFYNAIWYADALGRLIQQGVFMVNYWVLAGSGGLGLLYTGKIRPTYYVFQMYSHFGNEQVYASSGVADVTVYAAKREDGTLTILVINLSDTEQRIPLQVRGVALSRAEVWLFDATHNAEDLGQQSFPLDGALVLPAQSITLYAIGK